MNALTFHILAIQMPSVKILLVLLNVFVPAVIPETTCHVQVTLRKLFHQCVHFIML